MPKPSLSTDSTSSKGQVDQTDLSAQQVSLYLVAYGIEDARRRARVRRILTAFGQPIGRDAFEVPTTSRGAAALRQALAPELEPEDVVRIYPVCARCRRSVMLHGGGELASLPVAFVF